MKCVRCRVPIGNRAGRRYYLDDKARGHCGACAEAVMPPGTVAEWDRNVWDRVGSIPAPRESRRPDPAPPTAPTPPGLTAGERLARAVFGDPAPADDPGADPGAAARRIVGLIGL